MSRVASFAAALASLLAFAGAASPEGTIPDVSVDVETLPAQLLELSRLSSAEPSTGVTRLIFTEDDVTARDYVKARMADAGLEIREDAMGNIFGRWVGSEPHLPAVGSGSHTDAIPQSGAYDGTLGVLGPIEAIAALRRAGFTPRRSIEALMFTSEEPTRFGISCVGSRAMAAKLDPEYLAGLSDVLTENGTFLDAAKAAGYASDAETHADMVEACAVRRGAYSAFLELHIEQGPELEREGLDLGLVTAIAAPAALRCAFEGDGGHAGAQLMPARNDALAAAAELTLAVERLAKATGAKDTVATVGVLKVGPGAVNSVPRTAEMEIDVRDVDGTRRDALVDAILREGEAIASRRNARWSSVVRNADPPTRAQSASWTRRRRRRRDSGSRPSAWYPARTTIRSSWRNSRPRGCSSCRAGRVGVTDRTSSPNPHTSKTASRRSRWRSRGYLWTRRWRARNRTRVGWDRRRRPIDRRNYECVTQATASRVFFR